MDVPTPAAPKNDEHFSEKKCLPIGFFLPKSIYRTSIIKRHFSSTEFRKKKYFVFQKMSLVISLFLRWAKLNPSLLNKEYPFLPMALRNP